VPRGLSVRQDKSSSVLAASSAIPFLLSGPDGRREWPEFAQSWQQPPLRSVVRGDLRSAHCNLRNGSDESQPRSKPLAPPAPTRVARRFRRRPPIRRLASGVRFARVSSAWRSVGKCRYSVSSRLLALAITSSALRPSWSCEIYVLPWLRSPVRAAEHDSTRTKDETYRLARAAANSFARGPPVKRRASVTQNRC
jgi:hypothetical protein